MRVRILSDSVLPGVEAADITEIVVPGNDLRRGLRLYGYPDFGLWIYRSHRLYLAIRCGPASARRAGGSHAHNDQLAIELAIDGDDWIADPGSYLYCAPLARRNRWRSVRAHSAPQWNGREPARLDLGAFRLVDSMRARCLRFDEDGFAGEHHGYGRPVRRHVAIGATTIRIEDYGLPPRAGASPLRLSGRDATRAHFAPEAPYSPGYGRLADTSAAVREPAVLDAS